MTRIAGLTHSGVESSPTEHLAEMLRASQSAPVQQGIQHSFGDWAIGASGRSANLSFQRGGVLVVMDGDVYNRAELGPFRTDAEAIATLYEQHGFPATLAKLNGDFAIALLDSRERALWIGRDRFGVKPLYYYVRGSRFAFASRPRALLRLPYVSHAVNQQFIALVAASHYRYFDNDPGASPYVEIQQLPASHALCFKNDTTFKTRYWTLEEQPDWTESEEVLSGQYRELLLDSVAIRLRRAKGPAFTLSGGMDSSSVLASAVHVNGETHHAFSTLYADRTFDESREIRSMLDSAVTKWHAIPVDTPDVFSLVERMIAVHDEPVATATWLSHFLLCEAAAEKGFGTLFGGLGGDELNAGEFEHFFYFFADLRRSGDEARLAREVNKWIEYHDHPIYRKSSKLVEDQLKHLVDLERPGRCIPDRARLLRYQSLLNPDFFDLRRFEPVLDHPFRSFLKNRTYQDLVRETIPCCLRAEDRNSNAFGLDCLLPFFDHRMAEFMFRVPGTMKYRDGVTKHLLRQATRGILPEATRTRVKKTGWNAPAHIWFANGCRQQLVDLIHSQRFRERGIYNLQEVERLLHDHCQIVDQGCHAENHMMFLWQLVNLDLWLEMQTCVEKRIV